MQKFSFDFRIENRFFSLLSFYGFLFFSSIKTFLIKFISVRDVLLIQRQNFSSSEHSKPIIKSVEQNRTRHVFSRSNEATRRTEVQRVKFFPSDLIILNSLRLNWIKSLRRSISRQETLFRSNRIDWTRYVSFERSDAQTQSLMS